MIQDAEFDRSPFAPGETRVFRNGGNESLRIAIRCFLQEPPPPGLKPCPSCGVIDVASGQEIAITANEEAFMDGKGVLSISIQDSSGAEEVFEVEVVEAEPKASPSI